MPDNYVEDFEKWRVGPSLQLEAGRVGRRAARVLPAASCQRPLVAGSGRSEGAAARSTMLCCLQHRLQPENSIVLCVSNLQQDVAELDIAFEDIIARPEALLRDLAARLGLDRVRAALQPCGRALRAACCGSQRWVPWCVAGALCLHTGSCIHA